jgi:NAD(P)H-dependent FMN reductase
MIASPEYNSSITGVLKNAIDWASRKQPEDKTGLACFVGKVAVLMSASPGQLGGLRGLVHLRSILGNIDVLVLPSQVAIPQAADAILPDGTLKDPKKQEAVEGLGRKLAEMLMKLKG